MKAHTEDEFKKLLKTLFLEKKRVKDLKRRLEGEKPLAKLEAENTKMRAQLEKVKPVLRELALRCKEGRSEKIEELEQQKEYCLDQAYRKMREMSRKNGKLLEESSQLEHQIEDLQQELKKAQVHIGKKLKESAILHDLVEKQKLQIEEGIQANRKLGAKIEQLQKSVEQAENHQERMDEAIKKRAVDAEVQTRQWQQKYLEAQEQLSVAKREQEEHEKLKREYTDLVSTVSNLKNMLNE
ncbi:MAG: hypothetical protein S4CHLAM81_09410 [Chlamydiales bacterium]|nr:hypothetical protein [Chlamydiales bacterium]MCH9635720.1 hypothetical protein [Chlamydiales bacterium]